VGARNTRMSAFGGGTLTLHVNDGPTARILAPETRAFFVAGDTVRLEGTGSDEEDRADELRYRWEVDLHHNVHVHPSVIHADAAQTWFLAEQHDDGTGVWMRARLIVTDRSGASDTTHVDLFPEIDLRSSGVGTSPASPGEGDRARFQFTIDNFGRMPSPRARWRLVAGTQLMAEGDTLVPANGRAVIDGWLPPLAAGTYDLRVAVDTLGAVVETDESNNGDTRTLVVVSGPGVVDTPKLPRVLALSEATPNPAARDVAFTLDLPHAASVQLAIFDVQGREVWRASPRSYSAGSFPLTWSGRGAFGGRAGTGLYFARVRVAGREFIRRVAIVR
jgi:hypothetical protein